MMNLLKHILEKDIPIVVINRHIESNGYCKYNV